MGSLRAAFTTKSNLVYYEITLGAEVREDVDDGGNDSFFIDRITTLVETNAEIGVNETEDAEHGGDVAGAGGDERSNDSGDAFGVAVVSLYQSFECIHSSFSIEVVTEAVLVMSESMNQSVN